MPTTRVNLDIYEDVQVDLEDVLDNCTDEDIRQIIDYLVDNSLLKNGKYVDPANDWGLVYETQQKLSLLAEHTHKFSTEEENFLESMYKKYL